MGERAGVWMKPVFDRAEAYVAAMKIVNADPVAALAALSAPKPADVTEAMIEAGAGVHVSLTGGARDFRRELTRENVTAIYLVMEAARLAQAGEVG
jgi:hypothetical protein